MAHDGRTRRTRDFTLDVPLPDGLVAKLARTRSAHHLEARGR